MPSMGNRHTKDYRCLTHMHLPAVVRPAQCRKFRPPTNERYFEPKFAEGRSSELLTSAIHGQPSHQSLSASYSMHVPAFVRQAQQCTKFRPPTTVISTTTLNRSSPQRTPQKAHALPTLKTVRGHSADLKAPSSDYT